MAAPLSNRTVVEQRTVIVQGFGYVEYVFWWLFPAADADGKRTHSNYKKKEIKSCMYG